MYIFVYKFILKIHCIVFVVPLEKSKHEFPNNFYYYDKKL